MTSTSDSVQFLALSDDNTLISFNSSDPGSVTSIPIAGIAGTLLGIDVRPADGLIYGLTTANKIYTIDPNGLNFGSFSGSFTLTDAEEALLLDDALYVNLHTENFNGGALRGQVNIELKNDIVASAIPIEEAQQAGEVVPPDSRAVGAFDVVYDNSTNLLSTTGSFSDLTSALFAVGAADVEGNPSSPVHIHAGAAGENGPIVRNLTAMDNVAKLISTLSQPFEGGTISGFDFNPAADRLRLVGDNDQNFRINVDTGDVTVDGTLAFATDDASAEVNPNITAAAYTNSFAGTTSTQLYAIDTLLNTLVLQNPPNDGTLTTIGELGINFDTLGGFDILSSMEGENTAFAVSNATLYNIDLETGTATSLGMIGDDPSLNLQGLAVIRVMNETEMMPDSEMPDSEMPDSEMPDDLLRTGLNQLIDLGLDNLFSSDLDDFLAIAGVGLLNNEAGSFITLFDEAGNDIDSFEIPPIDGTILQQVAGSIDQVQDIILTETGPTTEIFFLQS